jgi:hypothetical protein
MDLLSSNGSQNKLQNAVPRGDDIWCLKKVAPVNFFVACIGFIESSNVADGKFMLVFGKFLWNLCIVMISA